MMEIRTSSNTSDVIVDPQTGVPHKLFEVHLNTKIASLIGWGSETIAEAVIHNFFGRLAVQWMGDDGFIRYYGWRKFCNTKHGDTIFGRGRVSVNTWTRRPGHVSST
jgi:hypothetical protein